jgi:hypothetical protein
MTVRALCVALLLPLALPASAEVEKFMTIRNGQMHPFYRLKFTPPPGWVKEEEATKKNGLAMYAQEGKDFSTSPALIYITVSYNHDKKTLRQFIDTANEWWRGKVKDTQIEKIAGEKRENGLPDFEVYRYVNPSQPNQPYELVAFGEDKDKDGNNFLMKIALSAKSKKALKAAEASYRAGLRAH